MEFSIRNTILEFTSGGGNINLLHGSFVEQSAVGATEREGEGYTSLGGHGSSTKGSGPNGNASEGHDLKS